jgi:predicted RecB family nuclease
LKPTTGTHVYQLPKCSRAVALELAGDRSQRRDLRPEEELVLGRGRDHEADFVRDLGWEEPVYPARDFAAGAAATRAMLEAGVPGVLQGVLLGPDQLGIADLLRREPGASALGDHHYVVGDVKSSARIRGDQILQVAFYSEMLATLQDRAPDYGYLVLKDGREERFLLEPFRPALRDVLARIDALRADPHGVRPFLSRACDGCRWSPVCLPELDALDDLSLVDGMTEGLRTMLEGAGVRSAAALADAEAARLARRTRIENALLRRLIQAARARVAGAPARQRRAVPSLDAPPAFVHVLDDPFLGRVLWMGIGTEGPAGDWTVHAACPSSRDEEWGAFCALLEQVPADRPLFHFGPVVPRFCEERAHAAGTGPWLDARWVDLARRVRGTAAWAAPVFGKAELIAQALGRDPHRAGRAGAAPLFAQDPDAGDWIYTKGASDLEDLRDLHRYWSDPSGEGGG